MPVSVSASLEKITVPAAANMPPTPWQTLIFASGTCAGGGAAHLPHALLQGVHAVHARVHVAEAAAVGVERQLAADGAVLRSLMKARRLARLAEAQVLQAVERQVGEGVVDHQVVDVGVA